MVLGIRGIEESSVYQDIFAKGYAKGLAKAEARGRAEGARDAVLRFGGRKLGSPTDELREKISRIADVEQLHCLLERILDVASWDELFAAQGDGGTNDLPTPRNGADDG